MIKFRSKLSIFALILTLIVFQSSQLFSQKINFWNYSDSLNERRLNSLIIGGVVLYSASMTGLYYAWYRNYDLSNFHFFNDNQEWQQMDKATHTLASYSISRNSYEILRWSGLSKIKSVLWSSVLGFGYQASFEIYDGFSSEWGFSWGDITANGLGTLVFASQQAVWDEQRILLKYSYHSSPEQNFRPDILGESNITERLKNYNGISVWASVNPSSFMNENCRFPKWLNIAVGYGADGMTGGFQNPTSINGKPIPSFERQRHFYISPDIDLSRIKVKNRFFKKVLFALNFFKIPMPCIEYTPQKGINGHWLMF